MAMTVKSKCWECGSDLLDGRGHRPSCAELSRQRYVPIEDQKPAPPALCPECNTYPGTFHEPGCRRSGTWRPEPTEPAEPDLLDKLRHLANMETGQMFPAFLPMHDWGNALADICRAALERIKQAEAAAKPPSGDKPAAALAAFRTEWLKWEIRRFDDTTLSVVRVSKVFGTQYDGELYGYSAKLVEQLEACSCGHKSLAEAEHELANQREMASLKAAFEAARAP